MTDKIRHIVLALQDKTGNYSKNIGVVIASIAANTNSSVCFHVFHDDTLSESNKEKLQQMCTSFQQMLCFHNIVFPVEIDQLNAIKYISMGTLYRLDIANQLKDVDKALYLDGDIVVHLDIKELFTVDMENKAILAVADKGTLKNPKLYQLNIPVKLENYFNAGVILFDLNKIRDKYNLLQDCLEIIKKYPKDFFTDQSALNHFLQDDCKLIDDKYNLFPTAANDDISRKCIWHFAGGGKPWTVRQFKVDLLYWQYLRLTPWGTNVDELFSLYSQTGVTVEYALQNYPVGSRKAFFIAVFARVKKEIEKIKDQFF